MKAEIECDGKILQKVYDDEQEKVEEGLEIQLKEYVTAQAGNALESGIDITNSFKKLGKNREWYLYYTQSPNFYEQDIEIVFEIDIDWID